MGIKIKVARLRLQQCSYFEAKVDITTSPQEKYILCLCNNFNEMVAKQRITNILR